MHAIPELQALKAELESDEQRAVITRLGWTLIRTPEDGTARFVAIRRKHGSVSYESSRTFPALLTRIERRRR
jgi:hypothetical protein